MRDYTALTALMLRFGRANIWWNETIGQEKAIWDHCAAEKCQWLFAEAVDIVHYDPEQKEKRSKNTHTIIHFLTSSGVSECSGARDRSEQCGANKRAMRADERVAQYCSLDSWLFWPTVL